MLLPSNIPRKPMNPKKSQQNKLSLKHESQENPLKIETHKLIFVRAGERDYLGGIGRCSSPEGIV
jgi:hypothetical protein